MANIVDLLYMRANYCSTVILDADISLKRSEVWRGPLKLSLLGALEK